MKRTSRILLIVCVLSLCLPLSNHLLAVDEDVEEIMGDDLNLYNVESDENAANPDELIEKTTTTTTTTTTNTEKKSKIDSMMEKMGGLKDSLLGGEEKGEAEKGGGAFENIIANMKQTMIKDFLKSNPLSRKPREEVKQMILDNTKDKGFGRSLRKSEKLLNFVTDVLHDEKALPSFFGILNKEKELKRFSIACAFFFVLSFIAGLFIKDPSLFKRIFKKLGITCTIMCLNIGLFIFYFGDEVSPMFAIFRKSFLPF